MAKDNDNEQATPLGQLLGFVGGIAGAVMGYSVGEIFGALIGFFIGAGIGVTLGNILTQIISVALTILWIVIRMGVFGIEDIKPLFTNAMDNASPSIEQQNAYLEGKYIIGITAESLEYFTYKGKKHDYGIEIKSLTDGMPAKLSGLEIGDIIYRVDGENVEDTEFLVNHININPEKSVRIGYIRANKARWVTIQPAPYKEQ